MDREQRGRWAGVVLVGLGLIASVSGLLLQFLDTVPAVAGRLIVGGLITALLGSVALLLWADTLPPTERKP